MDLENYLVLKRLKRVLFYIFCGWFWLTNAQQSADTLLVPDIKKPYHKFQQGPKIFIDELHNNFHTFNGRYQPFSMLLQNDGYQVNPLTSLTSLGTFDILVISNAINAENIGNWRQPIYDAFTKEDIKSIKLWVHNGGRLLLIADHMPFSGAANSLANAFGFDFCDGFAQLSNSEGQPDVFAEHNNRLISSQITDGTYGKPINSVTTFTGSSFQIPKDAIGILKFQKGDTCLQPEIAWQFNEQTKTADLTDSYQGAILEFGMGRIAVFGEAAQFTSQKITNDNGTFYVGFKSRIAPNNVEFLRNLMLWLSAQK